MAICRQEQKIEVWSVKWSVGHLTIFITPLGIFLIHLCIIFMWCIGWALCEHKLHNFNCTSMQTGLTTLETFTHFSVQRSGSCTKRFGRYTNPWLRYVLTCNRHLTHTLQHAVLWTEITLTMSRYSVYWYCRNERKEWLKMWFKILLTRNCLCTSFQ